jgi:hypothetical protein
LTLFYFYINSAVFTEGTSNQDLRTTISVEMRRFSELAAVIADEMKRIVDATDNARDITNKLSDELIQKRY